MQQRKTHTHKIITHRHTQRNEKELNGEIKECGEERKEKKTSLEYQKEKNKQALHIQRHTQKKTSNFLM